MRLVLDADELAGDLPDVCARTGEPAVAVPVWFTSSRWWAWLPLAVLVAASSSRSSWAPLASWWGAAALIAPLAVVRGVTGRVPLADGRRARIANLRRRRMVVVMTALGLTWVAVSLSLVGSRGAGLIVLVAVAGLYATAVAMTVAARGLGVRGRPTPGGGVVLREVHPAFAEAVRRHRAIRDG